MPSLREQAPAHVVHIEAVSKTLGGGLRVGWLAAQGPVLARLARLKMNTDMQTSALPQLIVAEMMRSGEYAEHVEAAIEVNRRRRDGMLEALDRHLADAATWSAPKGGASVWVTFDRPVDERVLYAEAVREGMAFLPGGAMMAHPSGRTSARLSYSLIDPGLFDEAIRRLARALRAVHRRERVAALGPIS
jgi:DNA-binding transcriptional MocR family regulator